MSQDQLVTHDQLTAEDQPTGRYDGHSSFAGG